MDNNQPIQPNQNPSQPVGGPLPQNPAPLQPGLNQPQPNPANLQTNLQPGQVAQSAQPTVAPQQPVNMAQPQIQANPAAQQPIQNNPAAQPLQNPQPGQVPQFQQAQFRAAPQQQFSGQPIQGQGMPMGQPMQQQFQYRPQGQPGMPMGQPMPGQGMPMGNQSGAGFPPNQGFGPGQRPPMPGARAPLPAVKGPNPKSIIMGCLGFFGLALILFIVFVLFFVSQTTATGDNGLARSLGVNPAELTNTLVTITNLIFGLVVIITFFVGIFGVFRAAMAPKTDKPAKASGYRQAGISAVIFLIMTTLWVFISIYLSGKKVNIPTQQKVVQGIVTTPEETTKLTAPIDIKFDATKLPFDANKFEITFYQWDFGDGGSSTSSQVVHKYQQVGQYNVKLTVSAINKATGEKGDTTFEKLVTVSTVEVSSTFTLDPASGPAPLNVSFDASGSSSPAGQITTYEWDFNGQNNFRDASGATVQHTFDREGEYQVKLRVTDNIGQSKVSSQTVTVTGPDVPVPVIDIPTSDGKYYTNKSITFLGEKSTSPNGNISKYEWDFGDGTPKANTRTASHSYSKAGLYEIILNTTDEAGKSAQASQKITVGDVEVPPQAVIDTVPGPASAKDKFISGQVPFDVRFSGDQSKAPSNPIVDYNWDFDGDGQVDDSGTAVNYIYKTPGSYNATLTVIDSKGRESSAVLVVKVAAQDLQARLTADKVEGNEPLEVTFDASSSSYPDGQITSFEWDFGDGAAKRIDASQVTYRYTTIGAFTASVLAKASDGKTSKATIMINVRPVSLKACFTPTAEQGVAPLDVEFDPRCTQGAASKFLWDFGDGTTSRTRKPTHTFDKPGSYQVTLEVTDNSNVVNTFSKSILVTGTIQ